MDTGYRWSMAHMLRVISCFCVCVLDVYRLYRCIDSLSLETLCCSSWLTKVVPILNISRLKHVPCLLAKAKPRNLWGEDVHMEKPSRVAKWFASAEAIFGSSRPYLRTCVAERAHGCGWVGVVGSVWMRVYVCVCAFCLFCLGLPGRVWLCVSSVCMCVCVSRSQHEQKGCAPLHHAPCGSLSFDKSGVVISGLWSGIRPNPVGSIR